MNDKKKRQKNAKIFYCAFCDFECCKTSDWSRHLLRPKHQNNENDNKMVKNDNKKNAENANFFLPKYVCECGNTYKYHSGLVRHKKTPNCKKTPKTPYEITNVNALTNLVLEVVKQNQELVFLNNESQKYNQELTNKLVEMSKVTNNTMINSHNNNKTFNLMMFLNETCKDAMNITEFVDSLQLQLSDLEDVGKLGFVEGISNIIVKNLKAMDVHKRPVHCADKKREVIYIKDENKWEKENDGKQRLRKAIQRVAIKNEKLLPKYKELHPGCNYSESKYSDHYSKLVIEAMGGAGDNDIEKQDKIIRNIAKEVVIDKGVL
jgi:hypothetical protein